MNMIRLGLAIALTCLALLWLTVRVTAPPVAAMSNAADEVEASQAAALVLTATVGIDAATCALTPTVSVRSGISVHPCYTIYNAGTAALTLHRVESMRRGVITDALALTLPPGGLTNTVALGLVITDSSTVDVTDMVTWTAQTAGTTETPTATVVVTGVTRIDVIAPAVTLLKTIGQDRTTCPAATTISIVAGQTATYCLTLANTGDITLTHHTLRDAAMGVSGSFAYTLGPGSKLAITPATMGNYGLSGTLERTVGDVFTNNAVYTATTANGLTTAATASARVNVGNAAAQLVKTVGMDPLACPTATTLVTSPGAQLYYCVTIRNTGGVTLTHHALTEPALAIDIAFDYPLAPGEQLTITNQVLLETLGSIAVFGPFEFSALYPTVVNNTMTYIGTTASGSQVQSAAATSATFSPTPTATPTRTPRPTSTSIPVPTSTPSITPIPPTPTETPTPTWTPITPTPTPTRSYAISELATPTPGSRFGAPSGAPPELPTQPPFESPLDPALAAQAATATAAALFTSPLATPTPLPTDTPAPTATPVETPTPIPPTPTLPPPTEALPPTPTATPTPEIVYIVVTDAPTATPPPMPTLTLTPDALLLAAKTFDAAVAAAGWIWFLLGSLVFFVTAGIVAGLFFRQQERRRYDLLLLGDELDPDLADELDDEDEDAAWPTNLP